LQTVLIKADISSDASGRTFAGVKRMDHPDKVVAREFWGPMLHENIQVKEGGEGKPCTCWCWSFHRKLKGKPWFARLTISPLRLLWKERDLPWSDSLKFNRKANILAATMGGVCIETGVRQI
jgi:hypothetical protein